MSTSPAALLPPPTTDDDEVRAHLDEFGVAVVADMLNAAEVAAVRQRLVEQLAGERAAGLGPRQAHSDGSGPVHYTFGLVSKGEVFRDLIVHPKALAYARHVLGPDLTLFSYSGNAIGPGAPGGGPHTDQIYMPASTPWPVVCNVIYMLDDFTEDNGATLVVPGSHRRSRRELNGDSFAAGAVSVTGPAGSALVMESRVWHSIGVNRTADVVRHAILAAYGKPFLRPQENWTFSVPEAVVAEASPELRELLGFRIWRSLGGVNGPYGVGADGSDPMDWGWVEPQRRYVGELTASGEPRE
jgi:ectoine hydroxylase-related dioxygenase (phytanoyl-CoA dioxygenase family)